MEPRKKIKNIEEEIGEVTINFKNGMKRTVPSKTIYTYYEDGTNDCKIEIPKPLDLFGDNKLKEE